METSIEKFKLVKRLLTITYGLIPIVAGADKFTIFLPTGENICIPDLRLSCQFSGNYLDVAVRDIAMAIGAFSLAQLSTPVKSI